MDLGDFACDSPVIAAGRYRSPADPQPGAGWNDFWYAPADPTPVGADPHPDRNDAPALQSRHLGLVLDDFFGPDSWASRDLADKFFEDQYVYTFWWSVPPNAGSGSPTAFRWLVLFWFTIGLWTRISSILSVVVVISFAHRVPEALFGLDKINLMLTLYLAVGPSGKALSVDSWLARRRAKVSSPA